MDLSNLVAVSGLSGLYKMAGNRKNGLVLENIDTGKKNFYASRKHQFTPLESISIYTTDEGVELSEVFNIMKEQFDTNPPISPKSDSFELRAYFAEVLPKHDEDKVYISDIKKLIKWYGFLAERDMLVEKEVTEEENEEDTATDAVEDAEVVTE
ncbi:MAG: DUF5606 domain-containing protein [Saprospiraceae bacterium]